MSDTALAEKTCTDLVDTYYHDVYGTAYRLTGNEPDALDLTQETFKNVLGALASGTDIESPKAYLMTAMKNAFFRGLRKGKHEGPAEDIEDYIETHQLDDVSPPTDTISSDDIQDAIGRLDENFRLPLVLFYYNECSYEEISRILDVPIGTVMSRLARAKRFVKLYVSNLHARG